MRTIATLWRWFRRRARPHATFDDFLRTPAIQARYQAYRSDEEKPKGKAYRATPAHQRMRSGNPYIKEEAQHNDASRQRGGDT